MNNFKAKLLERGYPGNFMEKTLAEVNFEDRGRALLQNEKENKQISAFCNLISTISAKLKKNTTR